MSWLATTLFVTAGCLLLQAHPGPCCGARTGAAGKLVEIPGTIGQAGIVPGQGAPYFELKHSGGTARVYLGPMPFLIAENFNPQTGQEVVVKGFQSENRITAARVTFVAEKRTVTFRDEQGWPVWRGRFGRGRGPRF